MQKLGKYLIRRELGKGAMGVVYEAFDPLIERTVAIKTIRPEQLNKSQAAEILARFKREAQAAGRLNHPHIVAVYEYGEEQIEGREPIAYIAMEFVRGRELRDYFEANERFPLPTVQRIMGEILDALAHAHERGVIHRDMKPANIIVLEQGAVKVADFGIARLESSDLTQAGSVLGTPAYMSPEQFLGQPVDTRTDIFSCGVLLYQFLTGEKPFTGNVTTIMYKVLSEEPLPPSRLNATLPSAWDAIVRKAMAKKPEERFQSAVEFATALRTLTAGGHLAATRTGSVDAGSEATAVDRTADPEATLAPTVRMERPPTAPAIATAPVRAAGSESPQLPAAGTRRSLSPAVLAAVAASVAALGLGAYLYLGPSPKGERAHAPASPPAPASSDSTAVAPATSPPAQASALRPGAPAPVPLDVPAAPGTMVISALGLVDPKDPRFNGDQAAAQAEARAEARRALIDKALAVYVQPASLDKHYALVRDKLLVDPAVYIESVLSEGAPHLGKDGLVSTEARAAVRMRALQKSLNQMSKEERIEFIRKGGDPKISVSMTIRNADTAQALPPARSQLAENVVKERIRSFGFRVWAAEGDAPQGTQQADFHIDGEVKVKRLSMRLEASGITVSKTALTSWTVKALDRASGEEIYLNTTMPKAQSWASEDQALAAIGRLVGEEFSKNFFLQHFSAPEQKVVLQLSALAPAGSANAITQPLLRELRSLRQVLDAQPLAEPGHYQLRLAPGNPTDLVEAAVLKPLNAKLQQACFLLAGATGSVVTVRLAEGCAEEAVRARLESAPPAGTLGLPVMRNKSSRPASI